LSDGDTTYYAIVEGETAWEVGLGTFTASGTTLSRDTILESSNAGAAINLAAEADVFITYPAEKSVYLNASGNIDLTGNIVFEGSTADDFETTLTVADPTADRTFTLPDQTGTATLWQSAFLEGGSNYSNIPIGDGTLSSLTTGSAQYNVGIGRDAGRDITTGDNNVCIGALAGSNMTTGGHGIAIGTSSGLYTTTSDYNVGVGGNSLAYFTGTSNVGIGFQAGLGNLVGSSGSYNVGVGRGSLLNAYTCDFNVGVGYQAGNSLTTAGNNVAIGVSAMYDNATDTNSTAVGNNAGRGTFLTGGTYLGSLAGNYNVSSKDYQVAIGYNAMNDCDGDYSVAVGANSMTDGNHFRSVAVGYLALSRTSTSSPYYNVAVGYDSGDNLYSGDYNVFVGYNTDTLDNTSSSGVAIGASADTTTGSVSVGYQTMASGTSASIYNINIGYQAGFDLDGGDYNSFMGYQSGYGGGTGNYNTGVGGYRALYSLTTASYAAALGNEALYSLTEGDDNSAFGAYAGRSVNTGTNNTFLGYNAGYSQGASTTNALTTGSNVTCVGYEAVPSGATATNEITLGDNNITSLRCNVQTISSLSDERDKTAIADISYGLDFINDMRPVQFTWNRRDGSLGAKTDIGFIAQELHDVEIDHSSSSRTRLVNWSNPEKLEADYVRSYPILVKAVQELSAKCDALEARLAALEGT
jgi:hypothetical protein